MGGYFLEANNFIPADPLKTPEHIAPVWYFTPYYAMLRAVPSFLGSQFWGVLVMGVAVLIFFALPWLDRGAVKSIRYRGALYKAWLAVFVVSFLILGYLGVVPITDLGPVPRELAAPGRRRPGDRRRARAHRRLFPLLPADAVVHGARQDEARAGKGDRMMSRALAAALRAAFFVAVAGAGRGVRRRRPAHRARADQPARRRVAAARRAHVRQLLPQLPQREVHALQPADRPRPRPRRMIRDNLMFATDKIGETMTVAMTPQPTPRPGSARRRPT